MVYMKKKPEQKSMKTSHAAFYLGISPRYLQKLADSGVIPVSKVSARCHLYKISDLDAFLEEGQK